MKKIILIVLLMLGTFNLAKAAELPNTIVDGLGPNEIYQILNDDGWSINFSASGGVYKYIVTKDGSEYTINLYSSDVGIGTGNQGIGPFVPLGKIVSNSNPTRVCNGSFIGGVFTTTCNYDNITFYSLSIERKEALDKIIQTVTNGEQLTPAQAQEVIDLITPKITDAVEEAIILAYIDSITIKIESPIIKKKKSKADKIVDTLTGKNKNLNSLGDVNRLLETYGDIYIDVTIYEDDETTVRLQHKNEHGDEYTGVHIKKTIDFNCIIFKLCRK